MHQFYSLPTFARMLQSDAERDERSKDKPFTLTPETIVVLHAEGLEPTVDAALLWCADPEGWLDGVELAAEHAAKLAEASRQERPSYNSRDKARRNLRHQGRGERVPRSPGGQSSHGPRHERNARL
jgi:hypothetical protein